MLVAEAQFIVPLTIVVVQQSLVMELVNPLMMGKTEYTPHKVCADLETGAEYSLELLIE